MLILLTRKFDFLIAFKQCNDMDKENMQCQTLFELGLLMVEHDQK
jgi:hypothetical protein